MEADCWILRKCIAISAIRGPLRILWAAPEKFCSPRGQELVTKQMQQKSTTLLKGFEFDEEEVV